MKPRLMVTLPPETMAVLQRISRASGQPSSTFVAEMLTEATPYLTGMATALEQAKEQKAEAFQTLAHTMAEAQVPTAQLSLALQQEIAAAKKAASGKVEKSRSGKVAKATSAPNQGRARHA